MLFDPSRESPRIRVGTLSDGVPVRRAGVEDQLMFDEASRQAELVPLDRSSTPGAGITTLSSASALRTQLR